MDRYAPGNSYHMTWLLGGAAAGLLAMYFGDHKHGRRRRQLAAGRLRNAALQSQGALDAASRDLGNRLHGLRTQAERAVSRSSLTVDDDILAARVRQRIGRAISHPRAIEVRAQRGRVTLSGPVPVDEKSHLLAVTGKVLGVNSIDDRLSVHEQSEQHPAAQIGHRSRSGAGTWMSGWRAAALAAGGTLAAWALRKRAREVEQHKTMRITADADDARMPAAQVPISTDLDTLRAGPT